MREMLNGEPETERSRREYQRVITAYRRVYYGATGLTFYDDEVTNFFSPHAEGKSAIFLVAVGKSAKGNS